MSREDKPQRGKNNLQMTSDKGLLSTICNEVIKPNNKKIIKSIKNGQKT
jgi:Asp-tRNA(Asn)/Glu-tRNA(Gln) amidotransferase B subunit